MIPRSEGNQLSELPGRKFTRPAGVMHDIRTESAKNNGSKIANICMHQPAELHLSISKANPTVEHPLDGPSTGLFASAMHGDCVGRSMFHPGMEMAAFVENNIEPHILDWNYWPIGLLNPKLVGNNREVRKAQKPLRVHAMIFGLFHHPDFKKKDKPIIDQVSVGDDRFAGTYQDVRN